MICRNALNSANDGLCERSGRLGVGRGVGKVSSRDDESAVADGIAGGAVDLGVAGVNVLESRRLQWVTKGKSDLDFYQ